MPTNKIRTERLEVNRHEESAVYRVYSADDELLYVGHTTQPVWARLNQHQNGKRWFEEEAAYVLVDYYDGIALKLEQELIKEFRPKYNERDYVYWHKSRICPECGRSNRSRYHGLCNTCRSSHHWREDDYYECQCHYCNCYDVDCPICTCQCDSCQEPAGI